MVKIAIDAGHGINTPGKRSPNGEREWSFNDKVLRSAVKYLNEYQNVQILRLDDPTGKTDVSLATRTNAANNWGADVLVSVHHNANTGKWGEWTGTETYTYVGSWPQAERLASMVHKRLVKAYGLRDRGLKKADLHMLRASKMTAILIEGGFMDSTIDIKKLRDDKVLDAAGKAIAAGLAVFFNLKKKVVEKPKQKVQPVKKDDIKGHWAETSLKKAMDKKIIVGYPDGTMRPEEPVTRAQLAVILDRLNLLN